MDIRSALKDRKLFLDGGTGTEFQKQGLAADPVTLNLTHPKAVADLHLAYLDAGADILTANTFGAYSHKHGNFAQIIAQAMGSANAVRGKNTYVALDMGPTGLMLEPYGDVTREAAAVIFAQTIAEGVKNGADLVLIETMMDLGELEIAVQEAKKTGLPVFATMSFMPNGRTMYGASIGDMAALLEGLGADAIGMNCGEGLDAYGHLAEALLAATALPVILQPNAGLPEVVNGVPVYSVQPKEYASFMADMAGKGVAVLGGCCGTTPAHLNAMVQACGRV